jgi:hypothetical protein
MKAGNLLPLSLQLLVLASMASFLTACPPTDKDDTGPEGDADADTDTDGDADADTDTDTDSDADADANATLLHDDISQGSWTESLIVYDISMTGTISGSTVAGNLEYFNSIDSTTICDNEIAYTGTSFTGDCYDCDWAFEVEGTVTSGDADCGMYPLLSLVPDGGYYALYMAFSPEYHYSYYGYDYAWYNIFMTGYSYDYYGYLYPGPYWRIWAYDGGYFDSTFTQVGNEIAWDFSYIGYDYDYTYTYYFFNYCDYVSWSYADQAYDGEGGQSDLPCDGTVKDVWSFEASAGDKVSVTVDTIAANSAADMAFYLNDPDDCTIAAADDNFDCTYPPTAYQCPSVKFTAETSGVHKVLVYTYGSCTGTKAGYELRVDLE